MRGIRDGRAVDNFEAPRVLLGNLGPIMVIGMARLLAEDGAEVIGQEKHPSGIVSAAGRLRPDVVVLDLNKDGSQKSQGASRRRLPSKTIKSNTMYLFDPRPSPTGSLNAGQCTTVSSSIFG